MAQNPTDPIGFYLWVPATYKNSLGSIRTWLPLKTAQEEEQLWIKDLSAAQIDSLEVQSLPYKKIYYSKDGKLFPMGSLLPERNIPNLLWTPIQRALPLQLPALNHNFFGVSGKLAVKLVSSDHEQEAFALLSTLQTLEHYMASAPAVRLKNLDWVLVGTDQALILRTPLLPLQGVTYWLLGSFLIPTGYALEYPILQQTLEQLLNADQDRWIVWQTDASYFAIPKVKVEALSLSSFRQSLSR